ncbi:hypothetical protein X878_0008 [Enterococcus phage VD13]|uniref:Uncharacterized protein n=1 Tax=Enterococcus phage VD13 TaxID=1458851 RepID=X2KRR0_9CAUD|nr:hypothetical protein X878_0008 [Enterococcus phage VD13]YP_009592452.1 hypothetical protein FDG77_gp11 [Enterococcus phage VD13]AHL19596.1 hypothetical protein VD13_011 [Enterococcus phage VD13]AHN83098.1 hypothetical protein X878_0008 [Enterococcus phage VD13]
MNIASIDRGAYTSVDVSVRGKTVVIENINNLITFNKSGVEQLIQVLQQAIKELPEEPKYVVVLPQKASELFWEYFYLADNGSICNSNKPYEVLEDGVMTLSEIRAFSEHYEPFAIPVEEFKQEEIGEF